jgi:hypothetical protein
MKLTKLGQSELRSLAPVFDRPGGGVVQIPTCSGSARVPVVIVMLLAIFGGWGTHYDAFPAGFPLTGAFEKWSWGGALVQMTVHLGNTVLLGSLFGSLGVA